MRKGKYKAAAERLYDVAEGQQGYFTAQQAIASGYADNVHPFHVKAGNWIREERGIYRLAKFPMGERPDMMLWYLWSRDKKGRPQGVYSHVTALSFYDLSDVNPAKLHMTVPPGFRRAAAIPKILVLHYGTFGKEDVSQAQGFKITSPLRTIVDVLSEGAIQMDHAEQAVKQAFSRGLITNQQLVKAGWIAPSVKKLIRDLAGKSRG